jgi:hypothetical protein
MVGPHDNQIRVVIAFADTLQEGYKLQTMIIDLTPIKSSKEQPSSVEVDLTSTVRSLSTGEKKQKILLLRWKKTGEIELRCDGQWVKQDAGTAIDKFVEATKAVIQSIPLNTKTPTDVTLSQELEQKISSTFNALDTENIPCLREVD